MSNKRSSREALDYLDLMEHETLMTGAEVAELFEVEKRTVRSWVERGWLTSIRLPGGGHRYKRAVVMALHRELMEIASE